jgi:hypothetical protein
VFLKRYHVAARSRRSRLVDQGLRPCHIVVIFNGEFGDPFVDKLARCFFDRSEIAARHMDLTPGFLFGRQGNCHGLSYRKRRRLRSVAAQNNRFVSLQHRVFARMARPAALSPACASQTPGAMARILAILCAAADKR